MVAKNYLKKKLKELDGVFQYWPVSMGMGAHGIPDCIGCYNGVFFAVEVKAPGRRGQKHRGCSALQVMQIKNIRMAGGIAAIVDGPEEVMELINELKNPTGRFGE